MRVSEICLKQIRVNQGLGIICSADLDHLKLIEWGNVDNLSLKGQKGQVSVKFEICLAG